MQPVITNNATKGYKKNSLVMLCWAIMVLPLYVFAQQPLKPVAAQITALRESKTPFRPVSLFTNSDNNRQRQDLPVIKLAPDAWFLTLNTKKLNAALLGNFENITLTVPVSETRTFTLELTQATILTDDFFVTEAKAKGIETHLPYCRGIYYRGIIQGDNNSVAAISLFEGEVMGVIANNEGNFTLGKLKNKTIDYVVYNDHHLTIQNPFTCATPDAGYSPGGVLKNLPLPELTNPQAMMVCDKVVKVYIQCANDMYLDFSSSTVNVTNHTTGLFNVVAALYANESISTQISQIFVWTVADPYPDSSSGAALDAFGSQVGNSFNGDLAHLFSTNDNGLGGVAWLDVLCSGSRHAYSNISTTYQQLPNYSWSVNCVTHEMGHNLGSPHTHACAWNGNNTALDNCYTVEGSCSPGPAPTGGGTIMSYCHLTANGINFNNGFGTQPGNLIRSRVTAATCLTSDFAGASTSGNTSICPGSNVQITASPTGSGYTYQWKLNGSNISGATSSTYNASATGNYTVSVVSAQGCTSVSPQVAVAVISGQPVSSFTYGSAGTSTTFSNSSVNANAYSWNFGDPTSGADNTSTQKDPFHTFSAPGNYTVTLTAVNNCVTPNLQNTSTQTITIQAYNPCNGNTNITDCTGTITDGSAGQNYNNSQSCSWLISPTGAETVTLTFTDFDTEADYDFVKIYDGTSASATLLGSFSGSSLPPPITSSGPSLYITFISDTYVTGAGFDVNYSCNLPVLCSGPATINNCSGTITDGSGTGNYANNMNCSWYIAPSDGLPIVLTFVEFNTQATDLLKVYNGANASAPLLGTFSGSTLPSAVTASSGIMYIEFTTDGSGTAAGWKTTYACTPQQCSGPVTISTCSGNFSDGSGSNNYTNNLSCSWLLAPTGATTVTLTFLSFSTELDYDFVKIYDGSNSSAPLLGSYSGTTLPPVLTSSGATLFVQFTSDQSVVGGGFTASYSCTLPGAEVFLKAFLQGPYNATNNNLNTTLAAGGYISTTQPFNRPPWNYTGTESVTSVPANIADWVLVDVLNAGYVLQGRRAAFLRQDGVLVDTDGSQGVLFNGVPAGSYYLVLRSRNHVPIMSNVQVALPNSNSSVNFINAANVRYGTATMADLGGGKYALLAGDCFANGVVSFSDFNSFFLQAGFSGGYFDADCNLDGSVNNSDFTIYTSNTGKMGATEVRY